jgi:cobalt-zinc-cadmium efflux system membrane fusion protein
MKRRIRLSILATLSIVLGCAPRGERGASSSATQQGQSWAVTAWGRHFELFPETDALVAGRAANSHVHVTALEDFSPVTTGSVTLRLEADGEKVHNASSSELVRPGIFNVVLEPSRPGVFDLIFDIEAEGVRETIPGGRVRVGDQASPGGLLDEPSRRSSGPVDGEPSAFLKEQQWRTPFATAWVEEGELRRSVRGTGLVRTPAGGEVILTASVESVVSGARWPHKGRRVHAGETLMELIPSVPSERSLASLEGEVAALAARMETASARLGRLEELLVLEASSRREVDEARTLRATLEARLRSARSDLRAALAGRRGAATTERLPVRAPFDGSVAEVVVTPGQLAGAGDTLARLVRTEPVWVEVALRATDAALISGSPSGLLLRHSERQEPQHIPAGQFRLVSRSPEVDAATGTVAVLFEVERSVEQLRLGARLEAEILLEDALRGVVVPASSIVDDAGVAVVYVQLEGEAFARREVVVRLRQGASALVEGLTPGERLVTTGASAIRRTELLASGSIEGHVH